MARPPVGRTLLGGRGRVEGPAGYVKKPLQPTSWSQQWLTGLRLTAGGVIQIWRSSILTGCRFSWRRSRRR
jgi:hypothetical protein